MNDNIRVVISNDAIRVAVESGGVIAGGEWGKITGDINTQFDLMSLITPQEMIYLAAYPIGGHRAVALNATQKIIYADNADLSQVGKVIGISTSAAESGAAVSVRLTGEVTEGSWSWTPLSSIYVGSNGVLTATPPVSGYSLIIGFAVSPTRVLVDIREPIILGA